MTHLADSTTLSGMFWVQTRGRRKGSTVVHILRVTTPLGPMIAGATEDALCLLEFADRRMLELQLRRVRKHFDALFIPGLNSILEHAGPRIGLTTSGGTSSSIHGSDRHAGK